MFIARVSKDMIQVEQIFAQCLESVHPPVEFLSPVRGNGTNDDFHKVSLYYNDNNREPLQHATFGSTWKWRPSFPLGVRCMRCFVHRFAEIPRSTNSPPASIWFPEFVPGNCSESLTMAILEGQQAGR